MKKKIFLISAMALVLVCIFAFSVSAENKIIKLSELPTLAEIHANEEAYISHLDAFDGNSYGEIDSESVVVLSDLQDPPTYYVYPSYYYIQNTSNHVYNQLPVLNAAIKEADSTAFAEYKAVDNSYCGGSCKYLIRFEMPTYVTALGARAKFESSTNLKEVYFPTHLVIDEETGEEKEVAYLTSISGQNLFSSCSSLEYLHNSEFLPAGLVTGNQDGFAGCKNLKEIKIPLTATSIGLRCFSGCSSIKEVILPNGLTGLCKGVFSGCSSLEKVVMGAGFKSFIRTNVDYETFSGCNSLKYVYFPATVADSLEAKANDYKSIFSSSNYKVTFFLTADESKAQEIFDKFDATNANGLIENAKLVAYDPSIDYTTYAETLGYSIIVYNYSACEAFYNGDHDVSENYTLEFEGERFLSRATKSKSCSKCIFKVDKSELAPLFTCLGYSSNNNGSVVQGFLINTSVRQEYESVLGEIEFGVIAAADLREDKEMGANVFDVENNISCNLSKAKFDFFEIKIAGLDEEKYDAYLFFCAYAKFGDSCYYINNGTVDTTATSTTYNSIK